MADKRTQLETVIQTAIDTALKEVHTVLPAIVTRVDHATQLIDAQITIKRKMSGVLVDLALLTDVPIRYPRSSTFSITFPIEVGDNVELRFCERSIDVWLTEGGLQNPFDVRKFDLSDGFATPAMYHQKNVIPDFDDTNMEFKTNSGNTKIIVKASEDVEIITTGEVKADCNTLNADVTTAATLDCQTLAVVATSSVDITSPISTINGNVKINGDLDVTGTITAPTMQASTSLVVNSVEMDGHVHPQGVDTGGDSQQNTGGPQ